MSQLALKLPWAGGPTPITNPTDPKFGASTFQLADALNAFALVAIYVGAFLMFFWMAWGVFDYIKAEGNKEALAKARKKIQWAIAGFIILLAAFFVSDYILEFLVPQSVPVTPVTPP